MNLANKITLCASGGVVLATAGAIASVHLISHSNRVNELRSLMSPLFSRPKPLPPIWTNCTAMAPSTPAR